MLYKAVGIFVWRWHQYCSLFIDPMLSNFILLSFIHQPPQISNFFFSNICLLLHHLLLLFLFSYFLCVSFVLMNRADKKGSFTTNAYVAFVASFDNKFSGFFTYFCLLKVNISDHLHEKENVFSLKLFSLNFLWLLFHYQWNWVNSRYHFVIFLQRCCLVRVAVPS